MCRKFVINSQDCAVVICSATKISCLLAVVKPMLHFVSCFTLELTLWNVGKQKGTAIAVYNKTATSDVCNCANFINCGPNSNKHSIVRAARFNKQNKFVYFAVTYNSINKALELNNNNGQEAPKNHEVFKSRCSRTGMSSTSGQTKLSARKSKDGFITRPIFSFSSTQLGLSLWFSRTCFGI